MGSSGAKLHTLALPLPTNLFSLFRRQTGSSRSPSPSFQNSGGMKTQKEKRKKKVIHTVENGKTSIRKYLTRTKPKTMLKIETNTHNEHQEHFPQTEYSQGTLEKHTKPGGSQKLFTHQHLLPTSTSTNTVNRRSSILETSLY